MYNYYLLFSYLITIKFQFLIETFWYFVVSFITMFVSSLLISINLWSVLRACARLFVKCLEISISQTGELSSAFPKFGSCKQVTITWRFKCSTTWKATTNLEYMGYRVVLTSTLCYKPLLNPLNKREVRCWQECSQNKNKPYALTNVLWFPVTIIETDINLKLCKFSNVAEIQRKTNTISCEYKW